MVALISYLLFRGTKTRPTTIEMMRYLEGLYGANFTTDIEKLGECQFIALGLELINQRFIPGGEDIFDEGLTFLQDVLINPLTENGKFKQSYFNQEKAVLKDDINSLYNNKAKYVYERCKQLMCVDEPYGIYKCGDVKTLNRIENDELYSYYHKLLDNNPIHLFVVGNLKPDFVIEKVSGIFQDFPSRSTTFSPIIANKTEIVPQQVIEEEKIRQGKLSIGYRTNLTRNSDLYPAMVVFNGIFGSLPHSKLFQNVREKAGLAYYIYSSLDSTKGIIQVDCGIESSDFEKVLRIVDKQLQNIINGKITTEELEFTIKSYSRQFRYLTDENSTLIDSCMVEVNNGLEPIISEFTEQLREVTIEDVRSVATRLRLDTVYFLKGKEGA